MERLGYMSRPHATIEHRAWALFAIPNGLAAGAVVGVLLTAAFSGFVAPWIVALGVGLVTGVGPFANISSLFWSTWSRRHDTIAGLTVVMAGYAACILAMAFAPLDAVGLLLVVLLMAAARIVWCGVVTLRAAVWRANYPRRTRTTFVARNQVIVALLSAAVGLGAGVVLERDPSAFRALFIAAAACALAGLVVFRRMRVRHEHRLRAARRLAPATTLARLRNAAAILREDRSYRTYLMWLFTLGAGTLMGTAPLILVMENDLAASRVTQVVLTASLPTLMIPLTTPVWARLLVQRHAIAYRALNSYVFVAAAAMTLLGATLALIPLLWLGAILQGSALAGGMLVWALAHNDFAPAERASDYLGLHVTLAGLRGLLAPLTGAASYSALDAVSPGNGAWALAIPLVLVGIGAIGFTRLERQARRVAADGH